LDCFRDFIVDGEDGFTFDHKDGNPADALHVKLRTLLENSEHLRLACAPALRAANKFEATRVADVYLADFRELLESEAIT
jgi:hypothetical protein